MTNVIVDWRPFDEFSEDTIDCKCGCVFRSHSAFKFTEKGGKIITRKPCPSCGENDNVRRSASDPEKFSL